MTEQLFTERFPFISSVPGERRQQILHYFRTAPDWLLDYFKIDYIDSGVVFIREGQPVDHVYLFASGIIKATDLRVLGTEFDFVRFDKAYAMGGMEVIMGLPEYKTTLKTVTKCIAIKIPRKQYEQWLMSDIVALQNESKLMGEYLLEQGRLARAYLLLNGAERLSMLLIQKYEKYERNGVLQVKANRQDLANETGLALKTITRSVKKLTEDGLITKAGRYLLINHEQYLQLKAIVDSVIDTR